MSKQFYITTSIFYVNGLPHLGHAYEKVITDVIARARRSFGEPVFFLTGLDEHGQKIQQAAAAEGKDPKQYCDELAVHWQSFDRKLGLTNDDFVRTTEGRHEFVVQALLKKLHQQGDVYKAPYEGWYSWRQESFLTDKDRQPDGTWDPIYGEVTRLVEENWYFKMGRDQEWLIDYIEKHPAFVQPEYRRNEILGFLRTERLEDLCISRPLERLTWGIPIPFDREYVNYVWFDALVNYLSVPLAHGDPIAPRLLGADFSARPWSEESGELWPADIHVIGKDIIRFHAIYWPIMLKAIGAPIPHQILAHGWWQKDGEKLSKSTGNVLDPVAVIDQWGLDAFRYYLVRELDIGSDGNWTDAGFSQRYHAELANGLGNLVNRSLSMLKRYRNGVVPEISNDLAQVANLASATAQNQIRSNELQQALITIWGLVTAANQFVDYTAPFKLAKDPGQTKRLDEVLYNLIEVCRILAVMLAPFLPETAVRIYSQLNCTGSPDRWTDTAWGGLRTGQIIGDPVPLFPRRDTEGTNPPATR